MGPDEYYDHRHLINPHVIGTKVEYNSAKSAPEEKGLFLYQTRKEKEPRFSYYHSRKHVIQDYISLSGV
jgi:hypothetical protein